MARTPLTEERTATGSVALNVKSAGFSQEQFFRLCSDNPELFFELTAQKELIIMPLPGPDTSWRNVTITTALTNWAKQDGTGITFDCQCLFILPNGSHRGPDASWLRRDRWDGLTQEQKSRAAPLCPEFVVELMSPSDRLAAVQEKMEEYIANGAQLGWLIDPYNKNVYVYRAGESIQNLESPATISGEPILKGFRFNVSEIW